MGTYNFYRERAFQRMQAQENPSPTEALISLWGEFAREVAACAVKTSPHGHAQTHIKISGFSGTSCIITATTRLTSGSRRMATEIQCPLNLDNVRAFGSDGADLVIQFKAPVTEHIWEDRYMPFAGFTGRPEQRNKLVYDFTFECDSAGDIEARFQDLFDAVQAPSSSRPGTPRNAPQQTERFRVE